MNWVLAGIFVYIAAQLAVGVVVARRVATHEDFLVAGRSLGPLLAVFTIFATWFGAETCVGAAGVVYESGFAELPKDPFGYGLCLVVMGAVFAVPLWRRKLTTLADLFRLRYGAGVERLAAILMVPTSVMWAAAQIRAFGGVLATTSVSLPFWAAVTIAALVVVVYTASGGLLADAVTDVVQGAALIIGLVVLLVVVVQGDGGVAAFWSVVPQDHLRVGAEAASPLVVLDAWAVPICGSVVAQELVSRILGCRSAQVARRATLGAAAMYLVVGLIPLALGLYAAGAMPGLDDPERALSALAQARLHPAVYVVFAGALVSAILSTVDSTLLAASSVTSQNVILSVVTGLDDRQKLLVDRACVFAYGVVAWGLALAADGVYELVEAASAFGSAGIFVVMAFGLATDRLGGPRAAASSLVAGAVVWGGLKLLDVDAPYLWALGAALAAYLGGASIDRRRAATAPAG